MAIVGATQRWRALVDGHGAAGEICLNSKKSFLEEVWTVSGIGEKWYDLT